MKSNLTKNVASTVLTRQIFMTHTGRQKIDKRKKAAPPAMINLLTKFHEDRTINVAFRVLTRKNAPPPGGYVFQATGTIFKHDQDIIGTNLLTKVLTRKNASSLGSHVFQANVTIFELIQDIIETNLLTKFNKDWTINKMQILDFNYG
ncbi:hypothetical protein DPMN_088788 [Dreissena polymorpha]|uniref:Uncharacterized protein n=1 Tax=Dreissena polymorpha TaxID=45954 RepID=A0A9D4KUQ7_DREPO|nr:hypothetical protein DPMN_088788 [Dreissena polymorpha]